MSMDAKIPFVFVLHQIDDGKWKVYDLNYDYERNGPSQSQRLHRRQNASARS
jgi:hypothetical protein